MASPFNFMEHYPAVFCDPSPAPYQRTSRHRDTMPASAPVGGNERSPCPTLSWHSRTAPVDRRWATCPTTLRRSPSVEIISCSEYERAAAQHQRDLDAIPDWALRGVQRRNDEEHLERGDYLRDVPTRRTPPQPSRLRRCRCCKSARHWLLDCPQYVCPTCHISQPGHRAGKCLPYFESRRAGGSSVAGADGYSGPTDPYGEENPEAL